MFSLIGTFGDVGLLAPHPDNFRERARELARRNCQEILGGPALTHNRFALEP